MAAPAGPADKPKPAPVPVIPAAVMPVATTTPYPAAAPAPAAAAAFAASVALFRWFWLSDFSGLALVYACSKNASVDLREASSFRPIAATFDANHKNRIHCS
jgi:hypothetical protein